MFNMNLKKSSATVVAVDVRASGMNESSEIDELSVGIRNLSRAKALAFGVCLLERAMPAFFQFQRDTGWVGGGVMRAAVAQCWAALEGRSAEAAEFVSVPECESVMPDSEGDFASDYTSAAIDAVDIACNLLVFLGNGEVELIVNSVTSQCDTIELFIQNDVLNVGERNEHRSTSLLKEEIDSMRSDLEFIRAIAADERVIFATLLERVLVLEYSRLRLKIDQ